MRRAVLILAAAVLLVGALGCGTHGDLQLVLASSTARAGEVIGMRLEGDAPRGGDTVRGFDSFLERRRSGRWVRLFMMLSTGTPRTFPFDPENPEGPAVGLDVSAPERIQLPQVPPGDYRITKEVVVAGRVRVFHAPLRIVSQ